MTLTQTVRKKQKNVGKRGRKRLPMIGRIRKVEKRERERERERGKKDR